MRHLDDHAVKLLEAGDESTRAHFAAHLSAPCEECETYLSNTEGPELLGGAADSALMTRPADVDASLDEVGFRRMRRALDAPRRSSKPPVWRVRLIAIGSMAAALVAVVTLLLSRPVAEDGAPESGLSGAKGPTTGLTLELQAAHQSGTGSLRRVDRGAVLPPAGALILRYYATEKGGGWLFAKRGDRLDALGAFALEPGLHPLRLDNGAIASLPLEEEAGELQLLLVGAGQRTPTLDEARQAVKDPQSSRFAITHLELRIEAVRR